MERSFARFALLAGVLFPVLAVLSFAIEGDTPDVDGPAAEVVEFYADNDTQVIIASGLAAIAAVVLLVFASSVQRVLAKSSETGLFASFAFAGGIVAAAGIAVDSAIRLTLANSAGDISPEATQSLFAFWEGFFWPIHVGLAVLLLGLSLSAFETKIMPVWMAVVGILAAVALFIPPPVAFVGLAVGALWVIVVSVLLFRQQSTDAATS